MNRKSYYLSTILNISRPHCFTGKMEVITSSLKGVLWDVTEIIYI